MKLTQVMLLLGGSCWCILLPLFIECAPSAYRKNVTVTVLSASNESSIAANGNETSVQDEEFDKRRFIITGSGLMPVIEKRKLINGEVQPSVDINGQGLPSNHQVRWLEPESLGPVESKVKSQIEKPAIEYQKPVDQEEDGSEYGQDNQGQDNNQQEESGDAKPDDKEDQQDDGGSEMNQQSEEQALDNQQHENEQSDYEQDNQDGELKYGERHQTGPESEKIGEYGKNRQDSKNQKSQQYQQPENQYEGEQQHQEEEGYHQPEINEKNNQNEGSLHYQDSTHYEPPPSSALYDNRNKVVSQYRDNPEIPVYRDTPKVPAKYQDGPNNVPRYQEDQYQKEPEVVPEEQYNESPVNFLEQPELVGRIPTQIRDYNQRSGSQVSYFWKAVPDHAYDKNKFNYVLHVSKIDLGRSKKQP